MTALLYLNSNLNQRLMTLYRLCKSPKDQSANKTKKQLDDEWPESIFHHVGSQSVSYLLSVQCEVLSRVS